VSEDCRGAGSVPSGSSIGCVAGCETGGSGGKEPGISGGELGGSCCVLVAFDA
jgi:hypothetical protein